MYGQGSQAMVLMTQLIISRIQKITPKIQVSSQPQKYLFTSMEIRTRRKGCTK